MCAVLLRCTTKDGGKKVEGLFSSVIVGGMGEGRHLQLN